jgi:hypothetical protein
MGAASTTTTKPRWARRRWWLRSSALTCAAASLGFTGGWKAEAPLHAGQRQLVEETGFGPAYRQALGGDMVHSKHRCGFVHFFAA